MDELVLTTWCDACYTHGRVKVPATAKFVVTIRTPGPGCPPKPRTVAVCEVHLELVTALRDLVATAGQPVEAEPEPGPDPATRAACPLCGKVMHRKSVVAHLVTVHGGRPVRQPVKCPDCAHRYSRTAHMARHRVQQHGYDPVAAVLATIKT